MIWFQYSVCEWFLYGWEKIQFVPLEAILITTLHRKILYSSFSILFFFLYFTYFILNAPYLLVDLWCAICVSLFFSRIISNHHRNNTNTKKIVLYQVLIGWLKGIIFQKNTMLLGLTWTNLINCTLLSKHLNSREHWEHDISTTHAFIRKRKR